MQRLKDGRVDFNDDLCHEHLQLLQGWYSGQWDPLYALQSSGTLNPEDLSLAGCNLSRILESMDSDEQMVANELICMLEMAYKRYCPEES
jgi:hypothetical protein